MSGSNHDISRAIRHIRAVSAIAVGILVLGVVSATAGTTPPAWTRRKPVCHEILLTSPEHPSGVDGVPAGGYSAYVLSVVAKHGLGCTRARQLAREHWETGSAAPLSWEQQRSWRATAGSAYFGDFVGQAGAIRVEYLAVH
jgi:hypothetical protein